jgi:hypothetical protein
LRVEFASKSTLDFKTKIHKGRSGQNSTPKLNLNQETPAKVTYTKMKILKYTLAQNLPYCKNVNITLIIK